MKDHCRNCNSENLSEVLNLGLQPPSNLFLTNLNQPYIEHSMRFGFCPACGLAQLLSPPPSQSIRSPHGWLSYNEPEAHLDDLVSALLAKSAPNSQTKILGITYKDDSTLARFRQKSNARCQRLDLKTDLEIHDPLAGLETIQAHIGPARASAIYKYQGASDILIARHLLEHAHEPVDFLKACQILTNPGGIMVFEVPDCSKMLEGLDHCFLWEEHIVYFNARTLRGFFEQAGFHDVEILLYPNSMEDSLVAVVKNTAADSLPSKAAPEEIKSLTRFGAAFQERAGAMQDYLNELRQSGETAAAFGAGHLTLKFINYYGLQPFLQCIIDDNPNKQGMFMVGSGLPILPSSHLREAKISLCLLGLNPESEAKVLQNNHAYITEGGMFLSVFSSSSRSINNALTHGHIRKS